MYELRENEKEIKVKYLKSMIKGIKLINKFLIVFRVIVILYKIFNKNQFEFISKSIIWKLKNTIPVKRNLN